ncbi:MAG: hypothetical protein M1134_02325 [Actinobacteria bacterium]|nr:hypothetical protein [Actinomycetota bacterium]
MAAVDLEDLTRWAVEGRYLEDLDEAAATDAGRAVEVALKVIDVVRSELEVPGGDK